MSFLHDYFLKHEYKYFLDNNIYNKHLILSNWVNLSVYYVILKRLNNLLNMVIAENYHQIRMVLPIGTVVLLVLVSFPYRFYFIFTFQKKRDVQ